MRMSRHERAIRDEIAELEKEIESIEAEKLDLDRRRSSTYAQRTMLMNLLEKAETPTEDAGEGTEAT